MKKLIKFILIFLFFCNLACNSRKESNITFLQYLNHTFNVKGEIADQIFIIIPCSGCSSCDQSVYSNFKKHFINNKNITLIICDPINKGLLSPTLKADNLKYDFLSKMADYDFGYGYPICIYINKNVIKSKYILTPSIIQSIQKYYK